MSPVESPDRLRQRSGLSRLVHHSHPSPPGTPRRPRRSPRPIEILHKCSSEPFIFPAAGEGCRSPDNGEGGWFYGMHTLNDVILSPMASPLSLHNPEGYEKEAKVVITVTVEGSPGPFTMLVKLGTCVDDIIKLVIQKYGEEGRLPHLHLASSSSFDLHLSYFSFQWLDRSTTIGDIGRRSFHLRKRSGVSIVEEGGSSRGRTQPSSPMVVVLPPSLFPCKVVIKIGRRMRKLFNVLGCLQHSS